MTDPGMTTTVNVDKDGNKSSSLVEASPETQAQTIGSTGSGALGALIGAASFVYSIVKDHGAKLTVDDARFKSEIAGEYSASGIWYTHTRAFGSLLEKHRGTRLHETTGKKSEFSSAYLCTVFPYQLRWNLYKVLPKPISDSDVLKKQAEFAKSEGDAYDTYREQVTKLDLKKDSLSVVIKKKTVAFRLKDTREDFSDYLEFVKQFRSKEPLLGNAADQLKANLAVVKRSRDDYQLAVTASRKTDDPFYVVRNITVQAITQHQGVRQRFWQNLSINSKFTITPRREKPYGFRVGLVWGETALGYGYPGVAGDFEVTQTGPTVGDIAITGSSKLGRRFLQFLEVKKDR
jgi:hypothetical protein